MRSKLLKRENEKIHDWILRISVALDMTVEQKDVMLEVAKQSYIQGSNDADELNKKYRQ
jgi:hypothetical protein